MYCCGIVRMKRPKTLVAMLLTTGIFLVVFYSMLNLQVSHSLRPTVENQEATIPTPSSSNIKKLNILDTVEPNNERPPSSKDKLVKSHAVPISEGFQRSIPKNGAYWNRKLHAGLRDMGQANNQTSQMLHNRSHCQAESTEVLRLNIQDFNSYNELYQDFLSGMDCRNFPVIIDQPNKCGNEEVFLLFAIKSIPRNFEQRQAVRDTWGKELVYKGLRVRTVFLLGSSSRDDPKLDQLTAYEAEMFGDLLQWDFKDSFFNLTIKEHMFLKWMVKNCPQTSFIFKGDDDVFANTRGILRYLQSLDSNAASKLYTGQIISNASPLRDPKIKYYVPKSFFDGAYPEYAGGGGFLFSGALLQHLHFVSHYIPFFPIDDVYTGMCFKALDIAPQKHAGFQTFDIRVEDRENPCVHRDLLLVHRRNPQQTMRLWRNMHNTLLTC